MAVICLMGCAQLCYAEGAGDRQIVQGPCLQEFTRIVHIDQKIERRRIAGIQGRVGEVVYQQVLVLAIGDGSDQPRLDVMILEHEAGTQEMVRKQGGYASIDQGIEIQIWIGREIAVGDHQCIQIGGSAVDDRETETQQGIEVYGCRSPVNLCKRSHSDAQGIVTGDGELEQGRSELVSSCKQLCEVEVINGGGEAQPSQPDLILHHQFLAIAKDRSGEGGLVAEQAS